MTYARLGHCCVYVIAPPKARPVKIGIATDIYKRLSGLQVAHWEELTVHWIAWTKSLPHARNLEMGTHEIMKANRIRGEWFDVPESLAREAIFAAAARLGIKLYSHDWLMQKVAYLAKKREEKEMSSAFMTGKLSGGA